MAAEAGVAPWDAEVRSIADLWIMIEGYGKRRRVEWEIARASSFAVAGPHLKDGTKLQRWWPMPWDPKPEDVNREIMKQQARREKRRAELNFKH